VAVKWCSRSPSRSGWGCPHPGPPIGEPENRHGFEASNVGLPSKVNYPASSGEAASSKIHFRQRFIAARLTSDNDW
jgi:hypothetical protein